MTDRAASRRNSGDRGKTGRDRSSLLQRLSLPMPMRRALAIVALAAIAGLAAFMVVSNDPSTYERESSFAIGPSDTVPPDAVPDVVGTLSDPDNAVTETIVDILGSARVRDSAARAAGLPVNTVAQSGAEYSWLASRRTGSTIVDLTVTGPNPTKVAAMQGAAAPSVAALVEANYSVYRLEPLGAPRPADRVGPKTEQTVFLAIVLGALLGMALVFAEGKLRSALGSRAPDRTNDGRPGATDDPTGETDRLESTLRESLGSGASVHRVGPGRIEVGPPEATPDRKTARRKR